MRPRLTYQVWVVVGLVVTVVIAAFGSVLGPGRPRVVIAVITVGLGAVLGHLATSRRADSRPPIGNERDVDAAVRDAAAGNRDEVAGT